MATKTPPTSKSSFRKLKPLSIARIVVLLVLAVLVGLVLNHWQFPGAWLIGPMLVGVTYSLYTGKTSAFPPVLYIGGKGMIAMGIAVRFVPETLATVYQYAIPLLCCVAMTSGLSVLNGYWLWRWTDLDPTTSLLASVPGAAPSIIAMAEEMGANAVIVSLFHSLRVFLVTLLVPAIANRLATHVDPATTSTLSQNPDITLEGWAMMVNLAILIICCVGGEWLGQKLAFPSARFLATVIVGIVVSSNLPIYLEVPYWLFATALLAVGLTVGLQFNFQKITQLLKAALIEVLLIVGLILACLVIGFSFHKITQVDIVTAVLGTTPGAIDAMVGIVLDVGGDAGLVFSMQITRLMLLILISSLLGRFWRRNWKSDNSE